MGHRREVGRGRDRASVVGRAALRHSTRPTCPGGMGIHMQTDPTWPSRPPTSPPMADTASAEGVSNGALVDVPDYVETAELLGRGRRFPIGQLVALTIGLAFLGGVGFLAVAGFSGDRGGAASPDEAVRALADALTAEDVVAILEIMAPSEVGTASDLYPRIVDLAVQEGALDSADWLAGIDVSVTDLETRTRRLHPDVALVELVAGTVAVSIDPELADPMFLEGDLEISSTIADMRSEMDIAVAEARQASDAFFPFLSEIRAPEGIFVMTVKRNGGWFVSPFYTGAEYGRQLLALPPADFAASRENAADGADSPAGVIEDMTAAINSRSLQDHLDAALSGDPEGVFEPANAFIPPDEAGVFLDYMPAYRALVEDLFGADGMSWDQLQAEMEEAIREVDLRGSITVEVAVREEVREDGAVVLYLESGALRIEAAMVDPSTGEPMRVTAEASWRGLCGRAELVIDGVPEEPVSDCVPTDVLPAGFDEPFVVVGEVGGDWYVSYVETALAYAEVFIEAELDG